MKPGDTVMITDVPERARGLVAVGMLATIEEIDDPRCRDAAAELDIVQIRIVETGWHFFWSVSMLGEKQ